MSKFFIEGVFSPAGIRRTPEEIRAMEDEMEQMLVDRELDILASDTILEVEILGALMPTATYCALCDHGRHRCPGCGDDVEHGEVACFDCQVACN